MGQMVAIERNLCRVGAANDHDSDAVALAPQCHSPIPSQRLEGPHHEREETRNGERDNLWYAKALLSKNGMDRSIGRLKRLQKARSTCRRLYRFVFTRHPLSYKSPRSLLFCAPWEHGKCLAACIALGFTSCSRKRQERKRRRGSQENPACRRL